MQQGLPWRGAYHGEVHAVMRQREGHAGMSGGRFPAMERNPGRVDRLGLKQRC